MEGAQRGREKGCSESITTTCFFRLATLMAADIPAGPAPTTITS